MVSNNTPLAGLAAIITVVAVIAVLLGTSLGNTDLLNWISHEADARAKDSVTKITEDKYRFDLQQYQIKETAKTEADLKNIQADLQAQQLARNEDLAQEQRRHAQELELSRSAQLAWLVAAAVIALGFSVGLAYVLVQVGHSLRMAAQGRYINHLWDPWSDPSYRAERLRLARQQERMERRAAGYGIARKSQVSGAPLRNGNGSTPHRPSNGTQPLHDVVAWQSIDQLNSHTAQRKVTN